MRVRFPWSNSTFVGKGLLSLDQVTLTVELLEVIQSSVKRAFSGTRGSKGRKIGFESISAHKTQQGSSSEYLQLPVLRLSSKVGHPLGSPELGSFESSPLFGEAYKDSGASNNNNNNNNGCVILPPSPSSQLGGRWTKSGRRVSPTTFC